MRFILLILVLVNLAYAAVQRFSHTRAEAVAASPATRQEPNMHAPGAASIVLVGEALAINTHGATTTQDAVVAKNVVRENTVFTIGSYTEKSFTDVFLRPATDVKSTQTLELKAKEAGLPGPMIPLQGGDDSGRQSTPIGDNLADPGSVEATVASSQPQCVQVGPIQQPEAATLMLERLAPYISDANLREDKTPDETVYWVHIPPRSSVFEAKAVVRALKARSIDSFVIVDEEMLRNGISLGVFHDGDSATRMRNKLGQVGYPIKVHHSPRFKTVQSISGMLLRQFDPLAHSQLRDLVRTVDSSAVVELIPCDGVASRG